MEKALGIGGIFFRAREPRKLAEWYRDALGIETFDDAGNGAPWMTAAGITVVSAHAADTEYFGKPEQQYMINFRVSDIDAMLAHLKAAGATVEEIQDYESMGKFSWATDPEGNRFELWQPAPDA
jgi:predicted enzyme related to lactoylglutathione lyase